MAKFHYVGLLSPDRHGFSWAHVATELCLALDRLGHEVTMYSTNGSRGVSPRIRHLIVDSMPKEVDIAITYTIPRNLANIKAKKKIHIYNYESSILPMGWGPLMNKHADLVLPSSEYVRDIFAKNGVSEDKLFTLPHGVDTDVFNPNVPPIQMPTARYKFVFVCPAIPHARKGLDVLLKAYVEEFNNTDPVILVLKTNVISSLKKQYWEVSIPELINKARKLKANPPQIKLIDKRVESLAALYTASNCLVMPTRAEGFSLTPLEAAACKVPTITTGYSGHMDFLNKDNAYLIDYDVVPAPKSCQYWHYNKAATIAEPRAEHLKSLMRKVYSNREETKEKGEKAYNDLAKDWTWDKVAKQLAEEVEKRGLTSSENVFTNKSKPLKQTSPAVKKEEVKKKVVNTSEKTKILYLIPYSIYGGAEVYIESIFKNIDRNKFEVTVGTFTNNRIEEAAKKLGIKTVQCQNPYVLEKFIIDSKINIVHFYNSKRVYNKLVQIKKKYRFKIVETIHSYLKWADSMHNVDRKHVDKKVCISRIVAKQWDVSDSHVIYNGIDINRFKLGNSDHLVQKFKTTGYKIVGTIARFSQEKNLDKVMEVAKFLQNRKIKFVIVGEGPLKNHLQNLIISKNLQNTVYLEDYSERTEDYYKLFDCFLLTSKIEGMPITILESLASKTPVVAPDVGGISEIVRRRTLGFVYHRDAEIKSIAKCIELSFELKDTFLKDKFDIKKTVKDLENIYQIVVSRTPPNRSKVRKNLSKNTQAKEKEKISKTINESKKIYKEEKIVDRTKIFKKISSNYKARDVKITTCLPTYNKCDGRLQKSVSCILNQTFKDFHLVIINDGSTDNTKEYLDNIEDKRVSVIHLSENVGIPTCFLNVVYSISKSPLLAFMGDDDILYENSYKILFSEFEKTKTDIIYGRFVHFVLNKDGKISRTIKRNNTPFNIRELYYKNFIPNHCCVFSKEVFDTVGGFTECLELRKNSDYEFWRRCSRFGFKFLGINKELGEWYENGENTITKIESFKGNLDNVRNLLEVQENTGRKSYNYKIKKIPSPASTKIRILSPSDGEYLESWWGDYWIKKELEETFLCKGYQIVNENADIDIVLHSKSPDNRISAPQKFAWIYTRHNVALSQIKYFKKFNHVFCLSKKGVKDFTKRKISSSFLSIATSIDISPRGSKKDIDVLYVGNPKIKKRVDLMRELIRQGVNISLIGPGWEKFSWAKPFIKEYYWPNDRMVELYSRSKIIITSHLDEMLKTKSLSARTLDILACREFCICDNEGVLEYSPSAVTYKNPPELIDKINYYLKNENERTKIASKCSDQVKGYTFEKITEEIERWFKR